jgi:sigma54-dependent transcription regulator
MKTAIERLTNARAASGTAAEHEMTLAEKVKAKFPRPREANEIEFIFRICKDARSCAEAGRAYYGTDKDRNSSDIFKKRLARFGLVFNRSAPGHLSPMPTASQTK